MAAKHRTALLVEDTPEFVAIVVPLLEREGFGVSTTADGAVAVDMARALDPDLVVLDLNLPSVDGVEVCRQLRTFSDAYVVMLTARDDEVDILVGLGVGADEYMTKPFSPREFVARVRTLMRRPRAVRAEQRLRTLGALQIDPQAREVRLDGVPVELTKLEFDLLDVLTGDPRVTFTRARLLEQLWGGGWFGDDHVVDVHVANLRRKLGDDPRSPRYVRTVRGVGYRAGEG